MKWDASRLVLTVATASVRKFATSESGDTMETTRLPGGGAAVMLVDGQGSGPAAKRLSRALAQNGVRMLADGVRPMLVTAVLHDQLIEQKKGQVSATCEVFAVHPDSSSVICVRNSHTPLWQFDGERWSRKSATSTPIGQPGTSAPQVMEFPISANSAFVLLTDGIAGAGTKYGTQLDWDTLLPTGDIDARQLANTILDAAIGLDKEKPADDMSVVVVAIHRVEQRLPIDHSTMTLSLGTPP